MCKLSAISTLKIGKNTVNTEKWRFSFYINLTLVSNFTLVECSFYSSSIVFMDFITLSFDTYLKVTHERQILTKHETYRNELFFIHLFLLSLCSQNFIMAGYLFILRRNKAKKWKICSSFFFISSFWKA